MNTTLLTLVMSFIGFWCLAWLLDLLLTKYLKRLIKQRWHNILLVSAGAAKPLGCIKLQFHSYLQVGHKKSLFDAKDVVCVSGESMSPKGCLKGDIVLLDRKVTKKDLQADNLIVIQFNNDEGELITKVRQFVELEGDNMVTGTYDKGEWRISQSHSDDRLYAKVLGRIGSRDAWEPVEPAICLQDFVETGKAMRFAA